MNENLCIREEFQPFQHLFTFLINQNLQLTKEIKEIKMQMSKQYEDLTNQQIENNENLKKEFNFCKQQIKDSQLKIDQLQQTLNEQTQINQNLNNKLNLIEQNLNEHNDHLTKLDNDQQESSIQSKQHLQFVQHRLNYLFLTRSNLKWKVDGQTIAGGNGQGNELNYLNYPHGIYVDHQQHIYVADFANRRIVKWKLGENNGEIVAGANTQGNRIDQLNWPTDVIVDENNKSLIICDLGNKRVVRWSLENPNGDKEILIENIGCFGLMMNENGDLFVSDCNNHSVKRWRKDEIGKGGEGTTVAGGNGQGNKLNQLNNPTYIFIDREETVYVSDWKNNRVMKWLKGASKGIIAAGGQGEGNSLNQLNRPYGLVVNEVGDIYVADWGNHRIMCWSLESKEGRVVVGGNGRGEGSNQLNYPVGLSFDIENNLYIVDCGNRRIQRFSVDKN